MSASPVASLEPRSVFSCLLLLGLFFLRMVAVVWSWLSSLLVLGRGSPLVVVAIRCFLVVMVAVVVSSWCWWLVLGYVLFKGVIIPSPFAILRGCKTRGLSTGSPKIEGHFKAVGDYFQAVQDRAAAGNGLRLLQESCGLRSARSGQAFSTAGAGCGGFRCYGILGRELGGRFHRC